MKRNAFAGQATWKQQPPKHYTEKPESIKRKQQQIQKTKRELGIVSSSTSYRQEQNDILLSFRDAIHLSSLIANFRRHYCLEITIIIIISPSLVQNIATISPLIITSYWTPTERYRLIWSSPERVIKKKETMASTEIIHISMVLLIEVIFDVNPLKWNEVSILALDFTEKCVWCWHHIQSPIFFLWCPEFNVRRQSYLMISLYSTLERHPCKRMATKLLN